MLELFKGVNNKILLALGIAGVITVMVVFWLWSQEPKYQVLFSNYSDKDGGAIVASLEQMNIPYKVSSGGAAIMVPSDQVLQVRLKLAGMGLPKGGNVGFELLENQKYGASQFLEQVNYQRALEGELERTIQAIASVENARVHLAIPAATVFVRDREKPTASILIKLQPGRTMDTRQTNAVIHLVASSVSNLSPENISLVDQNGNLMSENGTKGGGNALDPSQLKYISDLQANIAARVEAIIAPIVGIKNVHAQASAEVDFSNLEQAEELYKPNQNKDDAVIRSSQVIESGGDGAAGPAGVPGALSNQPPAPSTIPTGKGAKDPNAADATVADSKSTTPTEKNVVTNYEVNKTVRYSQKTSGSIKRVSVAVVVNDKEETDKKGKITTRPLTDDEKKQIAELTKQAMGYSEERGDTLSVVNTAFLKPKEVELPSIPMWKDPEYIEPAKDAGKLLLGLMGLFILYRKLLKPMVIKLTGPEFLTGEAQAALEMAGGGALPMNTQGQIGMNPAPTALIDNRPELQLMAPKGYERDLEAARKFAKENPKMVADVVTTWVSGNG